MPDNTFSGYLSITNKNQSFHYVYVQAENPTPDTPVLLWLNGGPGCSSMMGFFQEIGPYFFKDNYFIQNNHSWHKEAHLIFLESPSGVGFSKNPLNLTFTDEQVATDNLAALQEFFSNYPRLQGNPFYIAGESYAGSYIPLLAQQITIFNAKGIALINLKGLLIGNGVTNITQLIQSQNQYLYEHQFVYPKANLSICDDVTSLECRIFSGQIRKAIKHLNPYNIYDYCYYDNQSQSRKRNSHFMNFMHLSENQEKDHVPCVDLDTIEAFMNRLDVKQALNVDPEQQWYLCAPKSQFVYTVNETIAMQALEYLLQVNKYHIVLYNGDNDSVVPYLDTLKSIKKFNLRVVDPWRPYYVGDKQLGGFTETYSNGLTFVTVRGAGHMVPGDKPITAYYIFNQTIHGKEI